MSHLPDAAGIARLFAPACGVRGIILAVSGGPDSMALLRLAAQWHHAGAAPPISVATVDHGLRPQAADEAAQVAEWSASLGLLHTTLVWPGPHPRTRVQELARKARYDLLEAHALANGADTIALGHHLDDQAETVLFRLVRGSGIDGLAGMAQFSPRGKLTLWRPFLAWPKSRLVAVCNELSQPFFEDPSNSSPRYARTGLRAMAGTLAALGLDAPALARLASRAARARDALDQQAASTLQQLEQSSETAAGINMRQLRALPGDIVLRIIARLVAQVAPAGATIRLERLERLCLGLTQAAALGRRFAATLASTSLALDPDGKLTVAPEPARKRGRKSA